MSRVRYNDSMKHTVRDLIFVIILLLLMVGGLVWYIFYKPHAALPVTATSTSPFSAATTPSTSQGLPQHIINNSQYYAIDMQYPSSTPLAQTAGASADAAAVAVMQSFSQNSVDTFIKDGDFADMTPQVLKDMGGQQETMSDSYQLYTSPTTISYVFTVTQDTGGAHPNSYYQTFTFDSKTGQQLMLSDLFMPGSDYLSTLSSLSRSALLSQEGANAQSELIDQGTQASSTSFANFALDGANFDIFFAPYQVASYALGPQTVQIPLTQLTSILNTEYQ